MPSLLSAGVGWYTFGHFPIEAGFLGVDSGTLAVAASAHRGPKPLGAETTALARRDSLPDLKRDF